MHQLSYVLLSLLHRVFLPSLQLGLGFFLGGGDHLTSNDNISFSSEISEIIRLKRDAHFRKQAKGT